jgi:phage-related holin
MGLDLYKHMKADLFNVFSTSFTFKTVTGIFLTIFGFFFDCLLAKVFLIVIVLTLIDCLLGYYRAFRCKKHVVSRLMRRYMWKFVGYMIATSSLYLMSNAMPAEIQAFTGWLDNFALAFFAIHEAISIIEHLNELEVPLPTRLLGNLRKIKGTTDLNVEEHFNGRK